MNSNVENLANRLERQGEYVVDSEFRAAVYVVKNGHIALFAGKNGALCVNADAVPVLCAELMGIYEDEKFRARAGVRGA